VAVARTIDARGVAAFGTPGLGPEADAVLRLLPVDPEDVRAWARAIAAELATIAPSPTPAHARRTGHTRRHRASRLLRPGYAAAG
jgi:hypothetical protein